MSWKKKVLAKSQAETETFSTVSQLEKISDTINKGVPVDSLPTSTGLRRSTRLLKKNRDTVEKIEKMKIDLSKNSLKVDKPVVPEPKKEENGGSRKRKLGVPKFIEKREDIDELLASSDDDMAYPVWKSKKILQYEGNKSGAGESKSLSGCSSSETLQIDI